MGWGLVKPGWVRAALVGLGTILIGLTLFEMYLWWVVRSFVEISFIAGVLMSLPAAGLLVAGGYWLPRTIVSERYYPRIGTWTLAGTVLLGGFSVITGVAFFPELFWAQVGSARWGVSVGGGLGFFVGFLNVRSIEQRLAAERASIRAEEAEDQQELLEYLNALLRHEVLNTAAVIGGHADLIESRLDEEADHREYAGVIQRQTEELTSVIDDVRLLIEASDENTSLQPVDIGSILEDELRDIRDRHEGVDTEFDAPPEVRVMADVLVGRLFSNLFENAVKHNDGGPKRVSVTVTPASETVTVEIEDNGPGIPEGEREGLFDPTVKRSANHGLGLTIVARLADRYDGTVELVETGAEGTAFTVTLPAAQSASPEHPEELEGSTPTPPRTVSR